ncbi:hypothetical protein [Lactiplantibacillus plantarum]|uniref:hypothetical protein n=1 Tax=Lactiplantibacillus plantarum TaxID=1590 RepID=UPI0007C42D35|nr:hypothetical protein [Lactiplantibacillus plantarum]
MFGKNRTAPVPHRENAPSIKPKKVVKGPDKRFQNGRLDPRDVGKQPHVRIDIDDINNTPKVFIDGVEQQEVHHIELSWDEEDICLNNRYRIDFIDNLGKLHGIGQGK